MKSEKYIGQQYCSVKLLFKSHQYFSCLGINNKIDIEQLQTITVTIGDISI